MGKKYRRHGIIPFKRPLTEAEYQSVRRSKNPLKHAIENGYVDTDRIRKLVKEFFKTSKNIYQICVMSYFLHILIWSTLLRFS